MTGRSAFRRIARHALASALALWGLAAGAFPTADSVPGGIAFVRLAPVADVQPAPTARFGDRPVWVVALKGEWTAIVGLPLDTPLGEQQLISDDGGRLRRHPFTVLPKAYPEQRITLKDSSRVHLSAADEARAESEIAYASKLKRHWRPDAQADAEFSLPARGRLSSRFGLRRFFNGEPRSPHSGLDIALPRGSTVGAAAGGQVLSVDDFFFNGKTVWIDHGNGLITMYCHLDRIDVRPGEAVTPGQPIGLSGMTGRASGPHLHWSVIMNGATVDPLLFVGRPPRGTLPRERPGQPVNSREDRR